MRKRTLIQTNEMLSNYSSVHTFDLSPKDSLLLFRATPIVTKTIFGVLKLCFLNLYFLTQALLIILFAQAE